MVLRDLQSPFSRLRDEQVRQFLLKHLALSRGRESVNYLICQVLFQIFAPVLQFLKVLVFYQFCNNFVEYFLVCSSSYLYTANFPVFQYDYDVVHRNVISY